MRWVSLAVFWIGNAAFLAASADGQHALLRPGGGFDGIDRLLQNASVQKELHLSEEQIQRIKEVAPEVRQKEQGELAKLREHKGSAKEPSLEEVRDKVMELMKQASEDTLRGVSDVLKPEQMRRLKQIKLQQESLAAFSDPDVIKSLKLTDRQKESIRSVAEELAKNANDAFKKGSQSSFPAALKRVAVLRRESLEKGLAVLTPEQRKIWKELAGEPFEVKIEEPLIRKSEGEKKPPAEPDKK